MSRNEPEISVAVVAYNSSAWLPGCLSSLQEAGGETRLEVLVVDNRIAALLGPAAGGPAVELPYFVAIVGPDQAILAKQVFRSPIEFEKNRRRAGAMEQIDQTIPLAEGQTGADFEVLVGFQLTAQQLDYNRQQRLF